MRNVQMLRLLALWLGGLTVASFAGLSAADAQIYKYEKKDGSVVYTDSLAELPSERRVYYNQRQAELEAQAQDEESALGAEEAERRRLEKERAALESKQMEEAERQQRLQAMDAQLARYRERKKRSEGDQKSWQHRMKTARDQLNRLLLSFRKKQEEFSGLATKASYTLLPGQGQRQEQLARELKSLEMSIDAQIEIVEVQIPQEARKAGVPPGWIR